jgi:hypothetical protein
MATYVFHSHWPQWHHHPDGATRQASQCWFRKLARQSAFAIKRWRLPFHVAAN